MPIPLARRGTTTACAAVQSTAALFRRKAISPYCCPDIMFGGNWRVGLTSGLVDLDARGRSPHVRSRSQPTVRPRSRGSLPRLPIYWTALSTIFSLGVAGAWKMPPREEAARGRQSHELRKAPSLVADRAKEIDLQTNDHSAPGHRRRAHEVRLTAARRSPVENFRCLAAEDHQLLRVQPKCIPAPHQRCCRS